MSNEILNFDSRGFTPAVLSDHPSSLSVEELGLNQLIRNNTRIYYFKDPDVLPNGKVIFEDFDFGYNYKFEVLRFSLPQEFAFGVVKKIETGKDEKYKFFEAHTIGKYNQGEDLIGYLAFNFIRDRDPISSAQLKTEVPSHDKTHKSGKRESVSDKFIRYATGANPDCPQFISFGYHRQFIGVFKFRNFFFIPTLNMSQGICFYATEHESSLRRIFYKMEQFREGRPIPPSIRGMGAEEDVHSESMFGIQIYKQGFIIDTEKNEEL